MRHLQITGADRDAVRAIASAVGGTLTATGDHLTAVEVEGDRLSRLGVAAVVGLALIFTAIAIANTMVMATGGRTRELATLRLAGATTRQVLRMVALEALIITAVGVLLAAAAAVIAVAGLVWGIASRAPTVIVEVPWLPIAGVAASSLAIMLLASLVPAAPVLRQRPVDLAGLRE